MGLLKAGIGAAGGVLADSWREFFYCSSLDAQTLVAKGEKRTSERSSNVHGEENIISDGSIIAVNEGQFMIIVEQGAIVEACGEPGEFVFDSSTEPCLFFGESGSLGERLRQTFERFGTRFTLGGDTGKDQRVYFFNTKEIVDNKYGTASPVPFRVVDANIGLDVDISVRCNGSYSYRIVNPLLFYKNVCGNVDEPYRREQIDGQLKSELLTALQPAFARISAMGVRYSAVPAHTKELAQALNEELSDTWSDLRGIEVASFGVNTIAASPEDEDMIKQLQKAAVMRDPTMAAANLAAAQSDAMRAAASNEAGAAVGFMGMGMDWRHGRHERCRPLRTRGRWKRRGAAIRLPAGSERGLWRHGRSRCRRRGWGSSRRRGGRRRCRNRRLGVPCMRSCKHGKVLWRMRDPTTSCGAGRVAVPLVWRD